MKKLLCCLLFTYFLCNPVHSQTGNPHSLSSIPHNISQEITSLPENLSKRYEYRTKIIAKELQGSVSQKVYFFSQLILLILILLIPFIIHRFVERLRERFTEKISSDEEASFWLQTDRKVLQIWDRRLSPFIPWAAQMFTLWGIENLFRASVIPELADLIPYVFYYLSYKVFRRFVMLTLMSLTSQIKLRSSKEIENKIAKSSKLAGRFLFFGLIIHHSFELFVGKDTLYEISKTLYIILGAILLIFLAQIWKEENVLIISRRTKGKWAAKVTELSKGPLGFIAGIPIFILSVFLTTTAIVRKWSDEFDISKRVSARFFRKQLENSESFKSDDLQPLPDEYKEELKAGPELLELRKEFKTQELEEIKTEINEWLEEKSDEHSLAIYGDSGVGKSSILNSLEEHYSNIHVIHVSVPAKTTTRKQVRDFFSKILETKIDEGYESFIKSDIKREPTLVLLDKTHNMFLSKVNGLEGYREFLNIINAQTQNIFWCSSFHSYSWKFLDTIFKKNQYFRSAKLISRWSEDEIRSLIMGHHNKTSYEVSFKKMLEATQAIDETLSLKDVQNKFFRLIWEQSYGNPESALAHWVSALKLESNKTLCVTLPEIITQGMSLSDMPDEALFVYTALIKHESLSQPEAVDVTNLEKGEVSYAFKVGLETGSLTRDKDGRYQISTLKMPSLVSQLKKKNFIYGNE